jgi:hypothetical protein
LALLIWAVLPVSPSLTPLPTQEGSSGLGGGSVRSKHLRSQSFFSFVSSILCPGGRRDGDGGKVRGSRVQRVPASCPNCRGKGQGSGRNKRRNGAPPRAPALYTAHSSTHTLTFTPHLPTLTHSLTLTRVLADTHTHSCAGLPKVCACPTHSRCHPKPLTPPRLENKRQRAAREAG